MTGVVERIARALHQDDSLVCDYSATAWEDDSKYQRDKYLRMARVSIGTLIATPLTDAMVDACEFAEPPPGQTSPADHATAIFRAMLRVCLE